MRSRQQIIGGIEGTLVVVVPFRDGLVVASDTRSKILGHFCDGNNKVIFPGNWKSGFIAGTGMSEWISARVPLWPHDPCGDIAKNGITFFDAKEVAKAFVEAQSKPLADTDLEALFRHVIAKVEEVAASSPDYVRSFAGSTMFQLVFGEYDEANKVTIVRSVQFNLNADFSYGGNINTQKLELTSLPDYPHFGHTDAFNNHVIEGAGKEHLPKSLPAFEDKKKIEEVTRAEAEYIAIGLIEAAKKTSETVPDLMGIGGAIDAYLLDSNGRQKVR